MIVACVHIFNRRVIQLEYTMTVKLLNIVWKSDKSLSRDPSSAVTKRKSMYLQVTAAILALFEILHACSVVTYTVYSTCIETWKISQNKTLLDGSALCRQLREKFHLSIMRAPKTQKQSI